MYHPDCPFEVTTTNRYIITQHEAAICARKSIKAGQEIKFLSGTLVSMTKEEERDLGLTRRDFSVVMSSRRKTPSFFLGPARFANHDCDANGRLVTRGTEGMSVMATRNIEEGEEITVSYGDDYFGIENCECLCLTCERAVRNGWSDSNRQETTPSSLDEATPTPAETGPATKKRRRSSDLQLDDRTICSTPRKRAKFQRQTSKLREEVSVSEPSVSELPSESPATPETNAPPTPDSDASIAVIPAPTVDERQVSKLRQEIPVSEIVEPTPEAPSTDSPNEPAPIDSTETNTAQTTAPTDCESPSSAAGESYQSSTSSIPTSVDETGLKLKAEEPAEKERTDLGALDLPTTVPPHITCPAGHHHEVLSGLSRSLELDDSLQTVVDKTPKRRTRRKWHIVTSVETEVPIARTPGDYTKTSRLLAQKYDRWVDCQTCESWFVQSNSYQTRRECPRCERHSKLYGFQWPKTEGRDRVMDHRTIHRFLSPESEARVSRRDRGVGCGITPTPERSDTRTESEASEAPDSRRNTRASRRLTRELRMTM